MRFFYDFLYVKNERLGRPALFLITLCLIKGQRN